MSISRPPPRDFPTTGFEVLDSAQNFEEERLPHYKANAYYPMSIGEVIRDQYQIVAKLGYGTSSTVWLARDLDTRGFRALKVHVNTLHPKHNQELQIYQHLETFADVQHPGRPNFRCLNEWFDLRGPVGDHTVFVMPPLGMSLQSLQRIQPTGALPRATVANAIQQVFLAFDFLHATEVVHTDIHPDNLLIALTDESILQQIEDGEIKNPSPRKLHDGRVTYTSHYMLGGAGPLTVCDFGQARIGGGTGNAMPLQYRAPEVILNMPWGTPVDVWGTALTAWGLMEPNHLFDIYDLERADLNDAHHLAAMMAVLGPPPQEFLERSADTRKYWDSTGVWKGPVPLPTKKLADLVTQLEGTEKSAFVSFLNDLLCWLPEKRLGAGVAWSHPWFEKACVP